MAIVTPQEFMDKWGMNKSELAEFLDLSVAQVERWFFRKDSTNYQEPRPGYIKRLKEIDFILEMVDQAYTTLENCPEHIQRLPRKRKK